MKPTRSQAYQPLARKYRPGTFSELIGQESTASALANAIKLGREPHAVIFSGVRGIGKTTSARLYAKALNCDAGSSAEPCNHCESCSAIALGNHEDVIEIDGASNTSVDNIRSLRETISYIPQRSRFRVYIIDEVHMLSQSAFNALLKTLEEPPPHVVFIFATTELHKIPQTIMSRCQTFFLQRLSLQAIRGRLVNILHSENIPCEDKALSLIAREGHGSMRDALTLLDHVIAVGNGHVTMEALGKIVSHVSTTPFIALLEALLDRNANGVVTLLDQLEQGGVDMDAVAEKTASLARHAAVARDVGTEHVDFRSLGFDDEEARLIFNLGKRSRALDLNRIFRSLVKCSTELDGSSLDRYILENYCLEWCLDPGLLLSTGQDTHNTRVGATAAVTPPTRIGNHQPHTTASKATIGKSLHSLIDEIKVDAGPATDLAKAETRSEIAPSASEGVVNQAAQTLVQGMPATWRDLVDTWKKQKPLQARKLEEAHPMTYSAERIELLIPEGSYASASLLRTDEQKKLKDAFADLFQFRGSLTVTAKPASAIARAQTPDETPLPETLASIHEREGGERRAKIEAEARNHPLTRDAISLFDATIDQVTIHDS